MPTTRSKTSLLSTIIDRLPAVTLPPRWSFLEPDPHTRLMHADPSRLLDELRGEFGDDELLRCRIALPGGDGLVVNPVLATEDRIVIAACREDGSPRDLVTSAGCLSTETPFFGLVDEESTFRRLHGSARWVFLTGTATDAAILRSLGLAAAPVTGMDRLDKMGLQDLRYIVGSSTGNVISKKPRRDYLQVDRQGFLGDDANEHCQIVLVLMACDLAALTANIPSGILAAAKYLCDAQRHLDFQWNELYAWQPTEAELQRLEYLRKLGDKDILRGFFFHKNRPLRRLKEFIDPSVRSGPPLVQFLEDLVQAQREATRTGSHHWRKKADAARAEYHAEIDRVIFHPIVQSALSSADAKIIALRSELAHLLRSFHRAVPNIALIQEERPWALVEIETAWESLKPLLDRINRIVEQDGKPTRAMEKRGRKGPQERRATASSTSVSPPCEEQFDLAGVPGLSDVLAPGRRIIKSSGHQEASTEHGWPD